LADLEDNRLVTVAIGVFPEKETEELDGRDGGGRHGAGRHRLRRASALTYLPLQYIARMSGPSRGGECTGRPTESG
jgi:hypothetical protein